MLLSGKTIKHDRMMDVCFEVFRVLELPHKYVLRGQWINQGFVESFVIQQVPRLEIPKSDLVQWQYCKDPLARCLRYAPWEQCRP